MSYQTHLHEFYYRNCGPRRGPWNRGGPWGHGPGGDRPGWWSDWFGDPPPRAERGGVRYLVLDAIASHPRHGYEIISAIEERSRGGYRPSPGVIYPTLQMLEELQHARAVEFEGRRVYEITDAGRIDLQEHREEVEDFYDRLLEGSWESHMENFGEVMRRLGHLLRTFKRASRRGRLSASTLTKVREIVDEAIHKLEELLQKDE
jgi:DNA-binding PadR family transcriptional regulator